MKAFQHKEEQQVKCKIPLDLIDSKWVKRRKSGKYVQDRTLMRRQSSGKKQTTHARSDRSFNHWFEISRRSAWLQNHAKRNQKYIIIRAKVRDKYVRLQKQKILTKTAWKLTKLLHSDKTHMVWAEAWRAKSHPPPGSNCVQESDICSSKHSLVTGRI